MNFKFIETNEQLEETAKVWAGEEVLAIDLECENNLHHYGTYISLIQISNKSQHWVVDVLKLKKIDPLLEIFRNGKIQKIIHDVSFDLRILNHQFGCQLKNIFDTQLAANFLGKEHLGLGALLDEYFNIKKEKKFQRVDWTRRPLSADMLAYAVKDTAYLIELKKKLLEELGTRKDWLLQECKHLEEVDFAYKEQEYIDLAGAKSLGEKELGLLHALYQQRKKLAEEVDRPVFMIFSNKQLMAFVVNPPYSIESWQNLRSVHPIVKKRANVFFNLVKNSKPVKYNREKKPRMAVAEFTKVKKLSEKRNKLALKLKLNRNMLLSNEQIQKIIKTGKLTSLREWQKALVEKIV
jgi:ribonuclease D